MVKLAALLLALALAACTAPAPEGKPVNAAEPCEFRDPRDICPECTPTVLVRDNGNLRLVQVTMEGEYGRYAHTFDDQGRLLGVEEGELVHGCHVETGTVWFAHNWRTDYVGCWNTSGVEYECYGTPETWIDAMNRAASEP